MIFLIDLKRVVEIISLLLSNLFENDGFNNHIGFDSPMKGSTTANQPILEINCFVFFLGTSFVIDLITGSRCKLGFDRLYKKKCDKKFIINFLLKIIIIYKK